jgi:hypothetical protein
MEIDSQTVAGICQIDLNLTVAQPEIWLFNGLLKVTFKVKPLGN